MSAIVRSRHLPKVLATPFISKRVLMGRERLNRRRIVAAAFWMLLWGADSVAATDLIHETLHQSKEFQGLGYQLCDVRAD